MTSTLIREKLNSICLLLTALFVFISCDKLVPSGDVEGSVFFAGTIIPVAGVTLEVNGITAFSSEEGSYLVEGIPTGNYILKAEKTGFIPFTTDITVQDGAITVLIPMISPTFTSSVHGVVTGNFTGDPQPGLVVVMLNPDGSDSDISGTTDGEGNYQLQNVPFGDRTLVIKSPSAVVLQNEISVLTPEYQLDMVISEPMVFTDPRDNKSYTASKIGNQVWMVENLAYLPLVCPPDWESDTEELYYVYDYQGTDLTQATGSDNYQTYGVLYNWKAASSACPDGWHLPSDDEWKILEIYLGMEIEDADTVRWRMTGEVGRKLKSVSGWDNDGNGDNGSSFSALPGGSRGDNGGYGGIGVFGNWWTTSPGPNSTHWNRFLSSNKDGVSRYGVSSSLGFSVRCVKDD